MVAKSNHGGTSQGRKVFENSDDLSFFVIVSKKCRCGVRQTTDVNIMLSMLNNVLAVVDTEGVS